VTAPHRQKCPKCKGRAERLHSAPAIQFKGAGWYVTDYARKPASEGASAQSGGDTKAEKSEKPAAETKEKADKKEPVKKENKNT
jgi:hypothetical protein